MIEIEQRWIERFYFDPVMAAHVIMAARLETFQKARLRFFWFAPETIDSSGVGTGKTIVDFVYLNLRCILIPNHMAAIYFPNFQAGKKLPQDAFRRQDLGIWTIDGTNYYPAVAILLARRRRIVPQCARPSPGENFILGQDVAEPGSRHADFCAWVVFRVVELTGEQSAQATLERMGRYFHVAAVFAHQ